MIPAAKPENEKERIAALHEYNILDTLPDAEFDDITRIAADICGTPISLISLIDSDRQWFKSRLGLSAPETHRDLAFCAHAILEPNELFIVKDPSKDDRFHDNPLVTGAPNIAFYAGVPLVNSTGNALGTLCVIDSKPKDLTKEQKETLKALARQIVAYFDVRKKNNELKAQRTEMLQLNEDLSRFTYVVAHDMKSPCSSLAMSVSYLKEAYAGALDADGVKLLDMMEATSLSAIAMVDGILHHTQIVNADIAKESFTFGSVFDELKHLIKIPAGFTFEAGNKALDLYTSRYVLLQILLNLCNNAIKYNDKQEGSVLITASETGTEYHFSVKDNGPGIKPADQAKIFDLFTTLGVKDRNNNKGTGIGLSTVKRLIQKMGGNINIISQPGMGCSFEFTLSK